MWRRVRERAAKAGEVEEVRTHGMEGQVDGGTDGRTEEEVTERVPEDRMRAKVQEETKAHRRCSSTLSSLASPPCSLSRPVLSRPHRLMCSHLIFMCV